MPHLARRFVSGGLLSLLLAWILFWAPDRLGLFLYCALVVFFVTGGAAETSSLLSRAGLAPHGALAVAAVAAYSLATWLPAFFPEIPAWTGSFEAGAAGAAAVLVVSLAGAVLRADVERGWQRALSTTGVFVYLGLLGTYWVRLRTDFGVPHVALALLTTWMVDTGALLVGTAIGRTKLSPRVSPRKTVEGFIGGIAVAAVVVLASRALFPALPGTAAQVLVLCLLTGFVSHAGDLSESLLKRRAQVKDSSGVIPGQGGIMDKMDALLVTGPFFYYASRFWL